MTVGTFESLVAMEQRLHPILARLYLTQTANRIAKRALIHGLFRRAFHASTSTPNTCCVVKSSLI